MFFVRRNGGEISVKGMPYIKREILCRIEPMPGDF
jgi:hypothetical protein